MTKDKLSKIYIGNINKEATEGELRKFMEESGITEKQITGLWLKKGFAFVDCADQSSADAMIDKLQHQEFLGQKLTLEPSITSGLNPGIRSRIFRDHATNLVTSDTLKILIPSEFVGAIIGRAGANIKELTTSTGARINILRNQPHIPAPEKTACIIGSPERCTAACRKILEICDAEANNLRGDTKELSLKILANNNLIGRIIGRDGRNIKKIMQETQTKIHVSNQVQSESLEANLGNPMNVERVITVRGSVEGMALAEALISSKLRTPVDLSSGFGNGLMPSSAGFFPLGMVGGFGGSRGLGWDPYGARLIPALSIKPKNFREGRPWV